ncbi:MAG: GNAT family N-acetyltransferase [Chloroflexota bacterium]|nr:GNAT family N-acetyltransferase [Chloroflexota bacterium]
MVQPSEVGCRLEAHLRTWLGAWPPTRDLELVVWPGRDEPGWDGGVWPGLGVESPAGTVLSLSPAIVPDPAALDPARVLAALRSPAATTAVPAALGRPELTLTRAAFRWSAAPAALARLGEWVDRRDPRLPPWLRQFNGGVLVAWDERGRVAAGVGIKRHNAHGHELAVGTEPAHRGKGLARALVTQAARRVLAEGAVPLYLHDHENAPSARVAATTGFPDRGWNVLGLLPEVYPNRR